MRILLPLVLFSSLASANIVITTTSLSSGTVGQPYSATIVSKNGCKPATWQTVTGSLPPGITATPSANTLSLLLSGTPTTSGTFSFSEEVIGCGHGHFTEAFSILINPSTPPSHSVDLSWTAPTTPYVYFTVYRSQTDGGPYVPIASNVASNVYDDTNVTAGQTYYYVVTDTDNTNTESVDSNQAVATVPSP